MMFPKFKPCPLCGRPPVAGWDVVMVYDPDEYDSMRYHPYRRQAVMVVQCDSCRLRLERPTQRVVTKAMYLAYAEELAETWNRRRRERWRCR